MSILGRENPDALPGLAVQFLGAEYFRAVVQRFCVEENSSSAAGEEGRRKKTIKTGVPFACAQAM